MREIFLQCVRDVAECERENEQQREQVQVLCKYKDGKRLLTVALNLTADEFFTRRRRRRRRQRRRERRRERSGVWSGPRRRASPAPPTRSARGRNSVGWAAAWFELGNVGSRRSSI